MMDFELEFKYCLKYNIVLNSIFIKSIDVSYYFRKNIKI